MHDDNQDDQAPLSATDHPSLGRRALRAARRAVPVIAFVALGAGLSFVTKRRT